MHTLNIDPIFPSRSKRTCKFAIASLLLFIASAGAMAQTIGDAPNARIERSQKIGKMRHKCRVLSNQLVPKLSTALFMKNSQQQNEAYSEKRKMSFLQCLKLSKLATGYTPDLVTLQNSLPRYQKTQTTAQKPRQQTALTIKVKQQGAKIRILNIKPAYQDKILVKAGLYHIRVEKEGFARWDKWLKVKGKTFAYLVDLKPVTTSDQQTATQAQKAKTPNIKTETGFKYAKRRENPAASDKLAKSSALAAQKRAKRVAFIKAKVAAKKEAKRLALIQKQEPLGAAEQSATALGADTSRLQEAKFKNQVQINKEKLERGRRILEAQRKLNTQAQ